MKYVLRHIVIPVVFSAFFNSANAQSNVLKFDFGEGQVASGYTGVKASDQYSAEKGFGFEKGSRVRAVSRKGKDLLKTDFFTADGPFLFSIKLPEGNYNVKVITGDSKGSSHTVVRAECRRAVLPVIMTNTKLGNHAEETFSVHIRDTLIRGTQSFVRIKEREREYRHWDDKLTLEFNGKEPKVCGIEIEPLTDASVVFLAGNSTVVDQASEPYAAWGQMIPQFFKPGKIVVANYAESGEALNSFKSAGRLEKILTLMKPGDYLFIEFAHNDMKQKGEGIGPWESYTKLLHAYIDACRSKGGNPVLATSMHRRNFDSTGHVVNTLGDYPAAMRKAAKDKNVPLIDLHAMSAALYEAWGPKESEKGFVIYPAHTFPGQDKALLDNTHFNPYGATQIAKCIVQGIRNAGLPLASFIRDEVPHYDPAKPDAVASFYWPLSPVIDKTKPDGN